MWKDPIVAEIRRIRDELAAKHGFDLHAICEDLRRHQNDGSRVVVSSSPRRPKTEASGDVSTPSAGAAAIWQSQESLS